MAGRERRGGREFAPLPPGVVRVRLEGQPAADLARQLLALPGVQVVTGPDAYPGDRLYMIVTVDDAGAARPEQNGETSDKGTSGPDAAS